MDGGVSLRRHVFVDGRWRRSIQNDRFQVLEPVLDPPPLHLVFFIVFLVVNNIIIVVVVIVRFFAVRRRLPDVVVVSTATKPRVRSPVDHHVIAAGAHRRWRDRRAGDQHGKERRLRDGLGRRQGAGCLDGDAPGRGRRSRGGRSLLLVCAEWLSRGRRSLWALRRTSAAAGAVSSQWRVSCTVFVVMSSEWRRRAVDWVTAPCTADGWRRCVGAVVVGPHNSFCDVTRAQSLVDVCVSGTSSQCRRLGGPRGGGVRPGGTQRRVSTQHPRCRDALGRRRSVGQQAEVDATLTTTHVARPRRVGRVPGQTRVGPHQSTSTCGSERRRRLQFWLAGCDRHGVGVLDGSVLLYQVMACWCRLRLSPIPNRTRRVDRLVGYPHRLPTQTTYIHDVS